MSGPTGLPDGPSKKWQIPFYAIRMTALFAWALASAAVEAVKEGLAGRRQLKQGDRYASDSR
jgi:hypothetical protein